MRHPRAGLAHASSRRRRYGSDETRAENERANWTTNRSHREVERAGGLCPLDPWDLARRCRPRQRNLEAAGLVARGLVRPLSRRSGRVPAWPYPPLRSLSVYRRQRGPTPRARKKREKGLDVTQRLQIGLGAAKPKTEDSSNGLAIGKPLQRLQHGVGERIGLPNPGL